MFSKFIKVFIFIVVFFALILILQSLYFPSRAYMRTERKYKASLTENNDFFRKELNVILKRKNSAYRNEVVYKAAELALESRVLPGIDVLAGSDYYLNILEGKRAALITNQTGISADGRPDFQILTGAGIDIKKIFAPEHGYEPSGLDIPVITLHGDIYKPTPYMLSDVDVLIFDIQDVGARFYTYISTMAYCMEAAEENNKLLVVLDRPNPIGGELVQGNILDPLYSSFIGFYPIPVRHGMTVGELSELFNQEYNISCDLIVVPCENWKRSMYFDDTALPWVKPSPSMHSLNTAISYPGTCFFEGTNLSAGRGTDRPFEQIGAPWLYAEDVLSELKNKNFPGVEFEVTTFTPLSPSDGKYDGQVCYGIFLNVADRAVYNPVRVSLSILEAVIKTHPGCMTWRKDHFDLLLGTDKVRCDLDNGISAEDIIEGWQGEMEEFREISEKYLIYP